MRRIVLAVVAALALLAGCGDDEGGGENSSDLAARAVKGTEAAKSYRMRFKLDLDAGDQRIFMDGTGVSATDPKRSRVEGRMAIGEADPQRVEMLAIGNTQYLRGGAFEQAMPAGKRWLKVPDRTPTNMSPAEFIDFMRGTGDVEQAGTDRVNGVDAVHLRGPLDLKKLAAESGSQVADRFAQIPELDKVDATIDMWIDEAGERIARMRLHIEHPDFPVSLDVLVDFLEYDVPTKDIVAPPADQVADGSALGGG